jgi:hypothetical protein
MRFMQCGLLMLVFIDVYLVIRYCGVARVLDRTSFARFVVACGSLPGPTITIDVSTKTREQEKRFAKIRT